MTDSSRGWIVEAEMRMGITRLQELLPHAGRIEIEGASRMMHEENAAAYSREVASFLAEQSNEALPES